MPATIILPDELAVGHVIRLDHATEFVFVDLPRQKHCVKGFRKSGTYRTVSAARLLIATQHVRTEG